MPTKGETVMRNFITLAGLCLVTATAVIIFGAPPAKTPVRPRVHRVIRLRLGRLDIVNDKGHIVGSFFAEKDGLARLVFYDASGNLAKTVQATTKRVAANAPAPIPQGWSPVPERAQPVRQWKPCRACRGSGAGAFVCSFCSGKGLDTSVAGRGFSCSFCKGRGVTECGSCNGTGMVQE